MENLISLINLSEFFQQFPTMLTVMDIVAKSSFLLLTSILLCQFFNRISSSKKHLIYLNCIACILVVPVVSLLAATVTDVSSSAAILFTLTVTPSMSGLISEQSSPNPWLTVLFVVWLVPCVTLLLRLVIAAWRIHQISETAKPVTSDVLAKKLKFLTQELGISRKINVLDSSQISSPICWGMISPIIIFPDSTTNWSERNIEDTLIHELSHIKRLDWLTTLMCHCACAVFWFNPLVWNVSKSMLMTSEDCCDDAVLRYGKKDTHYAENLLAIAKLQRKGNDMKLLVQGIINKSSLANRIQKILDESLDRERASLGYLLSMAVFSFTLLVLFSNTKTMATEQSLESLDLREVQERLEEEIQLRKQSEQRIRDYEELLQQNLHELNERNIELRNKEATLKQKLEEKTRYKQSISESLPDKLAQREPPAKRKADIEMIPLFYVAPMYPTRAAREGIEGWVLLSFTVTALGNVSDIVVADSDPQDRFDRSAIRAAQKFSFAPRVENGIAVTVSDVQYLFNYKLQE